MLRVRQLHIPGLRPVDFELAPGECIALLGASGSGKSRLLRAIADLDPNDGLVSLDGTIREETPAPVWRRQVLYLATDAGWWLDQVGPHIRDWAAIEDELAELGLPPDCRDWPVSRLSTGERQRLALLRALSVGPRALLLDEPTSGLDADTTAVVERLLAARQHKGLALLWVTHDAAQAKRVADRVLKVRDGEVTVA